jgi:DGQHR domain-containing protein
VTKKASNKKRTVKPEIKKHAGTITAPLKVAALELQQGATRLYVFKALASVLYQSFSINRRVEGKDEGYQRVLSPSRVAAVSRYIVERKKPIPGAVIVSIDNASSFSESNGMLTLPAGSDVGWVIDGQHRLTGAAEAAKTGVDIELAVVAYSGLSLKEQIEQFITINREGKNVPTSLYLDLLHNLPHKNAGEQAKERAADLAGQLRKDEESPFFERIAVTQSPRPGQVSMVNFVRKITPHVSKDKGILGTYSEREQFAVIANYYKGLSQVFPKEFNAKDSIFFKTVGFGALWNVFQTVFSLSLKNHSGFTAKDVILVLKRIAEFDFSGWIQYGTGNQAELTAGEDIRTAIAIAFNDDDGAATGSLRV